MNSRTRQRDRAAAEDLDDRAGLAALDGARLREPRHVLRVLGDLQAVERGARAGRAAPCRHRRRTRPASSRFSIFKAAPAAGRDARCAAPPSPPKARRAPAPQDRRSHSACRHRQSGAASPSTSGSTSSPRKPFQPSRTTSRISPNTKRSPVTMPAALATSSGLPAVKPRAKLSVLDEAVVASCSAVSIFAIRGRYRRRRARPPDRRSCAPDPCRPQPAPR